VARVTPADQERLWWAPESIDWRAYWIGTHFAGLQEWVFPTLDDEFGPKPRSVYTYKELLELWRATTKLHKNRVALRLRPALDPDRDARDVEPVVYSYGRMADLARVGAGQLRARGAAGGRVMLMSENRPEWGIAYFAILEAGATAVPLDKELSAAEVVNLAGCRRRRR
jgi:long-chain acyl-CoA synthetase